MNLAILMSVVTPWAREMVLRLAELGHNIHVIDFAVPLANEGYLHSASQSADIKRLEEAVDGMHFIQTFFSSRLRYLFVPLQLRKILRECKAQKLLTLYGGGNALMAYLCGFRPYAVYLVGSDVMSAAGFTRKIARLTLAKAHTVLVNGNFLTQKARELAPEANLESLYIGVDTHKYSPGSPPAEPVNIICTRGFLPVYNNEYLIQALVHMKELSVPYTVTFVSSGPQLEAVRLMANQLCPGHIRPHVRFLGGVTQKQMVEALRKAHIFASLSRSDGTSISLLEALACGLFPVLSDIPPNREWLDERARNAALVPLDQPETLTVALEQAILDGDRRRKAAGFNRDLVSRKADSHKNMSILASKLESMP